VTDTQDQLVVLPAVEASAADAPDTQNSASVARAKRRSGSLSALLLPELQALAGSMGIPTGKLRKSELIAAIESSNRPGAATAPADGAETVKTRTRRSASRPAGASQPTLGDDITTSVTVEAPTENAGGTSRPLADGGGAPDATASSPDRAGQAADRPQDGSARDGQSRNGRLAGGARDPQLSETPRREGNRDTQQRDNQYRDGRNRDGQTRDGQARDNQARDGQARDNQGNRSQNRDTSAPRSQGRDNVNNSARGAQGDDDDEFGGAGRRGRRYRDRRGRNRERFDGNGGGGGGRNESEPTISDDDVLVPVAGILDAIEDKNTWFIRTEGYFASSDDVYVANSHVRRFGLRRGDAVTGVVRQPKDGERKEKFNPLVRLDSVNGVEPDKARNRVEFTKLTPLYPQERLRLETEPHILTTRVIDLVMPIGKGQRALVVSPPKAGKTMVLQAIANAIAVNNPECHLMVVLVDERPEEVTDMQRSVKGEVIASTFDRRPQDHITVAELSIERAKRLVEMGHDVVVLLDSITRLGRAYNLGAPASGRILSGGVDSTALYPPKRFLGAARNIEDGGSLTIIATALVETGSAGDTVIFEEFKGTGNAELKLDRKIADKRVFPAIDVDQSSTRKEEILLSPDELAVIIKLRRVLHALDPQQGIDLLLDRLRKTRTNIEFLMQIAKTTPGADDR
jgi:transcription termination factor Rho